MTSSHGQFASTQSGTEGPLSEARRRLVLGLRRTLWFYIALIFLEGPLRKWVVPGASNALLLARDPVVLVALYYAYRLRAFFGNRFLGSVMLLGVFCLVVSLLVGPDLFATIYGWRVDFLHIPVAYLIASVFTKRDLETAYTVILALALPNAILMMAQFHSPPSSFINSGAEDQFKQLAVTGDTIRPPGIFSFISGPANLYPLVAAVLLLPGKSTSSWRFFLRFAAAVGLGMAIIFCGSRTLWFEVAIVFATYILGTLRYRPFDFVRRLPAFVASAAVLPFILALPSVNKALSLFFENRIEGGQASQAEFTGRILAQVVKPVSYGYGLPFFGKGLGVGTSVGAVLAHIPSIWEFGDAETEWMRHVIESGVVLGSIYILMRVTVVLGLFRMSLISARKKDLSVLLLWSVAAPIVLTGTIGASTTLGFAVLCSGMTGLAARVSHYQE